MLPGWIIIGASIGYLLLLFAVASYGDRLHRRKGAPRQGRPMVYALSLAVYCTSWTYFGGVGLAAVRGFEFFSIYIGAILVFTLGMPLVRRITEIAKAEKITSIPDFMGARYGKNSVVAGVVALISLMSAIPYIALQLKAVSSTVGVMVDPVQYGIGSGNLYFIDLPLIVTLLLACFAIVFGTRHTDATEHQDGLILAIAMESVVKLVAFLTVGLTVVFFIFDGPADLFARASANSLVIEAMSHETPLSRWIVLIVISAFAVLLLPRQFHVTVVENRHPNELKTARYLFPAYLVAINFFVIPVAAAGLMTFGGAGDADVYVLTLPLSAGFDTISLVTFLGGFSAATAMVVMESVALSIMISNDIIMPAFLQRSFFARASERRDFARVILRIRRFAIFGVMLLGYAYYRSTDTSSSLVSIGLLAFTCISQIAPALLGGMVWRRANARGALAGMTTGFIVWTYLLFLPSLGGPDYSWASAAILSFLFPGVSLFGPHSDPLVNATVLSLLANTAAFVLASASRNLKPVERLQSGIFVKRHSRSQFATRSWKTRVSVGDLKSAIARYLGEERMRRSLETFERQAGRTLEDNQPADMALIHYSEQLLGSAIGSSSARLVLSLILQKVEDASADTAWLLDQASEALQYNQDMLQTALSQMDQGIAVFDSQNQLTIWNRRFRSLLDLPEIAGQVGFPLTAIVSMISERGDIAPGAQAEIVNNFATGDKPFRLKLNGGTSIIEVRSNVLPDKGIVATFTDITPQVAADQALKQANETLEQRVAERTVELTRVNRELGEARAAADEANLGKTRFFAAAGHDILQPLNAARLYSSALVERMDDGSKATLARNIDSALESVESILGAVLDMSRLDTGAMKPRFADVALSELLSRIETDFAPIAREKSLRLVVMPTRFHVRSDPNLLRRLVQNLVSNAIKYTPSGKVLVGARKRGERVVIEVVDSGIGIPSSKFRTIFKEFARLDEGAKTAAGLGLGLSIVDRIARVLNTPVDLSSTPGRGTSFRVSLPLAASRTSEQSAAQRRPAASAFQPLTGIRVLCIDNEPRIIEGMQLLISGWGCTVMTAASMADILALSPEGPAPDLVIADYHLDDGDGIEAILELRSIFRTQIPGLLVTADRTPDVRAEAEKHGIGLQNKPVKPAALRAYITQVMSLKAAAE